MNKIIKSHNSILNKIEDKIEKICKVDRDLIKLLEEKPLNDAVIRFQVHFILLNTDIYKDIYLNFEIYFNNSDTLCFESISGINKYSKKNNYGNLLVDVVQELNEKINDTK